MDYIDCQALPLRLRRLQPPRDDLLAALFVALSKGSLQNGDILFVSAKVVAIHQGRCRKLLNSAQRANLVRQEADYYIPHTSCLEALDFAEPAYIDFPFTIKGHTPVPFAGVDESNGNGWHILWPEKLVETAAELRSSIASHYALKELGLVIVDSTLLPLRRGCIGLSIAAAGMQLLHCYQGQQDLFGRELKLSENNIIDRLSNFASLFMGEGAEQKPIVVLRGLGQYVIAATEEAPDFATIFIEPEKDFYSPFFREKN